MGHNTERGYSRMYDRERLGISENKKILEKPIYEPDFVLMTENDKVKEAFKKLINRE